jgi:hypothetical protein
MLQRHFMRIFILPFVIFLITACNDKPEPVHQRYDPAVFPSPFIDGLNVQFSNPENSQYELMVFDPKGEIVFEKRESFSDAAYWIELSDAPEGTYHVVLKKDNTTFVRKVAKIE